MEIFATIAYIFGGWIPAIFGLLSYFITKNQRAEFHAKRRLSAYPTKWLYFYTVWRFPLGFVVNIFGLSQIYLALFDILEISSEFTVAALLVCIMLLFWTLWSYLAIYTYFELLRFSPAGYKANIVLLFSPALIPLLDILFALNVNVLDSSILTSDIIQIISCLVFALLNYIYFKNRKDMYYGWSANLKSEPAEIPTTAPALEQSQTVIEQSISKDTPEIYEAAQTTAQPAPNNQNNASLELKEESRKDKLEQEKKNLESIDKHITRLRSVLNNAQSSISDINLADIQQLLDSGKISKSQADEVIASYKAQETIIEVTPELIANYEKNKAETLARIKALKGERKKNNLVPVVIGLAVCCALLTGIMIYQGTQNATENTGVKITDKTKGLITYDVIMGLGEKVEKDKEKTPTEDAHQASEFLQQLVEEREKERMKVLVSDPAYREILEKELKKEEAEKEDKTYTSVLSLSESERKREEYEKRVKEVGRNQAALMSFEEDQKAHEAAIEQARREKKRKLSATLLQYLNFLLLPQPSQ